MNTTYKSITGGIIDWLDGEIDVPGSEIMADVLDLPRMIAEVATLEDRYGLPHGRALYQVATNESWALSASAPAINEMYDLL